MQTSVRLLSTMISFGRLLVLGLLLVTLPLQAFAAVSRCACLPPLAGAAMAHLIGNPMDGHSKAHQRHAAHAVQYAHHVSHTSNASHTAPHQHKAACASCAACAFCTAGISFIADTAPFNPALVRHIDFVALSLLHSSAIVDLPERPPRGILT